METGRSLALKALIRTGKEEQFSHLVLEEYRKKSRLSDQEARLFAFLYRGVLERKITLDYRLAPYLNPKNPPQKEAVWLLRLGLFQLLYATQITPYTAVSETVNAAKNAGYGRLSGLCNGVLRAFLRDEGKKSAKLPKEAVRRLSVLGSMDESLVSLLLSQMGEEKLEGFLSHSFEKKKLWFRINPLRISKEACLSRLKEEGYNPQRGPLSHSFFVSEPARLLHHPMFAEGCFYVQDLAAQAAAEALGAKSGEAVADLCAAPGTKSLTLAGLMENKGSIFAGELHQNRLEKILEGAKRIGAEIIHPVCKDASVPDPELFGKFDRVLLDVPCSGLGTLAGKPEIRCKKAAQIALLPEIQEKILCSAKEYVKIQGTLVYATCTVNEMENGRVVDRFLHENPGYSLAPLPKELSFLPQRRPGEVLLLGEELDTDGFYFCRMIRNE